MGNISLTGSRNMETPGPDPGLLLQELFFSSNIRLAVAFLAVEKGNILADGVTNLTIKTHEESWRDNFKAAG